MSALLPIPLLFALLCWARPATAQDIDPDAVTQLVGFIRWSGVLFSLLVIAGSSLLIRLINSLVLQLGDRFSHRRLTFQKLESFARFAIYLVGVSLVVTLSFRLNETVLALVGGTFAVAIGFAMRDLVAAMIAGVTIMLDRPFQVGDRVQFAGEYGDVTAIGLRSLRILTVNDNTVTIPNNKVLTDVTSCSNYGALDMLVSVELYIAPDQDLQLAEQLAYEAMLTSEYVYLDKPIVIQVSQRFEHGCCALQLSVRGSVLDTKYEYHFKSDVTRRALLAFQQASIRAPSRPPHA